MRFHEKDFAEEYQKKLLREGYPGKLLPPVIANVEGAGSLIDAGGGSGFFAIPIAELKIPVTLVEPSIPMLNILRRSLKPEIKPFIRIANLTWEQWEGERHSALLSAHSLYPMNNPAEAIAKMVRLADKRIVIVRNEKSKNTLGDAVRARFSLPRKTENFSLLLESILDSLKIPFSREKVEQEIKVYLNDINSEADHYAFFLKIENFTKEEVADFIKSICKPENGSCVFESFHSDFIYFF